LPQWHSKPSCQGRGTRNYSDTPHSGFACYDKDGTILVKLDISDSQGEQFADSGTVTHAELKPALCLWNNL
jgi:hypothetical protein